MAISVAASFSRCERHNLHFTASVNNSFRRSSGTIPMAKPKSTKRWRRRKKKKEKRRKKKKKEEDYFAAAAAESNEIDTDGGGDSSFDFLSRKGVRWRCFGFQVSTEKRTKAKKLSCNCKIALQVRVRDSAESALPPSCSLAKVYRPKVKYESNAKPYNVYKWPFSLITSTTR